MKLSNLKLEAILYLGAFLLALALRLIGAGRLPLTNHEADLALQALSLSRGEAPLLGPHPLYLILTTLWFYIFAAANWTARFWPALAGSLLVLLPLFIRSQLGKFPAALLAIFLALDPGLLAVSRQADGLTLALFFTVLALGLGLNRRTAPAGIAAGIALLCGPAIWPGLVGLGAAIWVYNGLQQSLQSISEENHLPGHVAPVAEAGVKTGAQVYESPDSAGRDWRRFIIFALLTIFFAGTLFFFIPNGLSAVGQSIASYLSGWAGAIPGISVGVFLLALVLYELLPLIFGLWGGINGWKKNDPIDRFLLLWWVIALTLGLIYPGRQVADLAWSLLPLWGLAARQIVRVVKAPVYDRLTTLGQALLAAIILGFISMGLVTMFNAPTLTPVEYQIRLLGAAVMLLASVGLIAWGWSRPVALRGLLWGASVVLVIYFISAGWNAVGLAGRDGVELWSGGPKVKGAGLLMATIQNLTRIGPQVPGGPEVVVVGVPSPALRWLLRGETKVTYAEALSSNANPALIITPVKSDLAMATSYRGEAFVLNESAGWGQLQLADWFRWLVFRKFPGDKLQQERVILWARSDLFPGGAAQAKPGQ